MKISELVDWIGVSVCLFGLLVMTSEGELALVPLPKKVDVGGRGMAVSSSSRVVISGEQLRPLGEVVALEVQMLCGLRPEVVMGDPKPGDIHLAGATKLDGEEYSVRVDAYASVRGGTYQAMAMGTVSLLQSGVIKDGVLGFPGLKIDDDPDSDYRGVMIDVARRYNSIEDLRQCVILCRWYKVNYIHLHLSDDHAWTFPSKAFPKLGEANRGFRGPVPQVYDRQELLDLVAFADARGVTLIPEIDVPGHSGAMRTPHPEAFDDGGDQARIGIVNMTSDETDAALKVLFGEVAEVFASSPYIHIGADEVNTGAAKRAGSFEAYVKKHRIENPHDLFYHFIARMNEIVKELGKQTMIWSDFHGTGTENVTVPKDIICMTWRANSNAAQGYVENGYSVINATWVPLYIVNQDYNTVGVVEDGRNKHRPETIYEWNLHTFHTCEVRPSKHLMGGQICAWEQGGEVQVPTLRDRLPAMCERLWNVKGKESWEDYKKRWDQTDRRLDQLIYPFTVEITPIAKPNPWLAPLLTGYYVGEKATCTFKPVAPGLTVRWVAGDKDVPADGAAASGPISLTGMTELSAQTFDDKGTPVGERWHKTFERHLIAGKVEGVIEMDYKLPPDGHIVQTATEIPHPYQGMPPRDFKSKAVVELEATAPGTIHFSVDGTTPTVESPVFEKPVEITDSTTMYAALFDDSGKQQGELWKYDFERSDPMPNITLGKPCFETVEGGSEGPAKDGNFAVDGKLNKDHWGAGTAPASLKIDLEKTHTLKEIHLFPYCFDNRRYTYTIEVSKDGKKWTEVVDARENRERATLMGHRHSFEPTDARYIRANMLSNSANRAVHIIELRAFE